MSSAEGEKAQDCRPTAVVLTRAVGLPVLVTPGVNFYTV